jgi:hypothetical protein
MKRILPFLAMFMLLGLVLTACGDEKAEVPTYSGATAVTVPDSVKSQFTNTGNDKIRNPKVEAFKTADSVDKIKTGIASGFSKGGWSDKLNSLGANERDSLKTIESIGASVLYYEKGNKGAIVMILPGTIAPGLQIQGVSASENLIMSISGND